MEPREFFNTIYLGDRFCKNILIDGYNEIVKIQINMISRIRSKSGNWEYYNDENIEDGLIVFTGVESIYFEPSGFIPNDEIEFQSVELIEGTEGKYVFSISAASCNHQARYTNVEIKIISRGVHLEDPMKLGVTII